MAKYKPYMHVCRLEDEKCDGLLDNEKVYVTSKIDGTNICLWLESGNGKLCCGGRNRKLSSSDDYAKTIKWIEEDNEQVQFATKFLEYYPNFIVYGEWLGKDKFLGSIKSYKENSLNILRFFDVYDTSLDYYIPDNEWRQMMIKIDPNSEKLMIKNTC